MYREIHNGYLVTGNHAAVGREYHVALADGQVVRMADRQDRAIAVACGMAGGDMKPKPKPKRVESVVQYTPPEKTAEKPKPKEKPKSKPRKRARGK